MANELTTIAKKGGSPNRPLPPIVTVAHDWFETVRGTLRRSKCFLSLAQASWFHGAPSLREVMTIHYGVGGQRQSRQARARVQ
jgi:hypothetical protein